MVPLGIDWVLIEYGGCDVDAERLVAEWLAASVACMWSCGPDAVAVPDINTGVGIEGEALGSAPVRLQVTRLMLPCLPRWRSRSLSRCPVMQLRRRG